LNSDYPFFSLLSILSERKKREEGEKGKKRKKREEEIEEGGFQDDWEGPSAPACRHPTL